MDLITGQRVVITGATSGIGRLTALELVRRGGNVTIVCRNLEKGKATAAEIESTVAGTSVDVLVADLSGLEQVRRVAAEICARYPVVDVLVNNAGVQDLRPRLTPDGFDHMVASNYLGPFLLTNLILDRTRAAAAARIVVVASEAHRIAGRLDPETFEHLGSYSRATAMWAYGRTKLLDLLFALELARRLEGTRVTANALCPGLVATNLVGGKPMLGPVDRMLSLTPMLRTPEQGARMSVRLATDPSLDGVTGRFFTSTPGMRFLPPAGPTRDASLQRRIWERTAQLVGLETAAG
ncbi:MAG: SDR family NAD(P)-dependent oxidoreductase [Actinobacteria bacterium]|nr:MAG: SDR family NAD(P)-dependent oxidoreductase [Actinomycetota bacterium]